MINLRYHIVSLVAVFLALAIGVVVGSTALKEGTVSVLRATSNRLISESEAARAKNRDLEGEVAGYREFGTAILPSLVRDRLKNQAVVVLDTDRVDDKTRKPVEDAIKAAGGSVEGRVTFASDRLSLAAEGDRTALGALLQTDQTNPEALRQELVAKLAERLTTPARLPPGGVARSRDAITGLQQAKFLADLRADKSVQNGTVPFPRAGSTFVIIGPTDNPTLLDPKLFLVPLAQRLSGRGSTSVVGVEASAPGAPSWVEVLRDDQDLTDRVSTVDDVDRVPGQFALVEALARSLRSEPTGQYGFKSGATGLLPEGVAA
ncbi:MAG TPA: copper transporter [Actinomycetes bacterium]